MTIRATVCQPRAIALMILSFAVIVAGCAPAADEPTAEPQPETTATAVLVAASGGGTTELPLRDEAALLALQGIGATPSPTVRLTTPSSDQVLEAGPLEVQYEIANYEVGQDVGQHVHVILDNTPYKADYSPTGSITFSAEELTPGTHLLTVFLSRRMHLSLKGEGAADQVIFDVGEPSHEDARDSAAPTLVYSRPKGDYSIADGAAANILLDFYLFNATLGTSGFQVRATVDGGPATLIDAWGPSIILTDPAPGEHTIRLELLDEQGNPVPGPINDTTRTFTVSE